MLARAFAPDFLHRLDRLVLGIRRARTLRLGRRALGKSRGSGIEIESFKDYVEGDDLRFLDWNAMARLDSLQTKAYRAERETETTILIDSSASMGVPQADDKFALARALGATLTYIALAENDPVRLLSFGGVPGAARVQCTEFLRRRESYPGLQPILTARRCGGATDLESAVSHLLGQRRPPGVAIVLSDFLTAPAVWTDAFSRLLGARYEVKAIQILGEQEADFRLGRGMVRLRDSESGVIREMALTSATLEACRRKLAALREHLRQYCSQHQIAHATLIGAAHFEDFVTREMPRLGLIQ